MFKLFVVFPWIFPANLIAQNLVPNYSFEEYSACPSGFSTPYDDEVAKAVGWSIYRQTPEYFHACALSSLVSVPYNAFGHQEPSTGNAYCGFFTYTPDINFREVIGIQLYEPLVPGKVYNLSFNICSGKGGYYQIEAASNKIGLRFSTVAYSFSSPAPINNQAHLYTNAIIADTVNWTKVSGSFIADSAYGFLAIGNFFDNANTDTVHYSYTGNVNYLTYYYVDDVCVTSGENNDCSIGVGVNMVLGVGSLKVYPIPAYDVLYIETGGRAGSWELYDATLHLIRDGVIEGETEVAFTRQLQQGIYLLRMRTLNEEQVFRVQIIH